jgi:hypothetical protein
MIQVTLSFNTVADAIAALREIPESVMVVAPAIVAGQPKPMNYEPAPLNPISEASDSLPQVEVRKPGRPKKIVSAEPEVAVVTPAVAPASPFSTSSDVVASPADEATVSAPVDPTPSPAPESTGAATENIDIETVREGLTRLHKRLGIDAVRKVLQRCKAGNVSGIDPKHYPKVMGWVQTMTAADLKKADE